jgi:hypothetical protein
MTQKRIVSWTNANPAVARKQSVGFTVGKILVTDVTNGAQYYWNSSMTSGYYVTVDTGAVTTSNGFTPLAETTRVGAAISGFTNANPGVITVDDTSVFGFATGDTVKVSELADDGSASTGLNGSFTVASVTSTTITLVENTTAYSVYVSGGFVSRVSDTNGDPVPIENQSLRGITIGTGAVGAASASMVAEIDGENVVL